MKATTCLLCCLVIGCGPAASHQDASVVGPEGGWSDAGGRDQEAPDSAPSDSRRDAGPTADRSATDRDVADNSGDAASADQTSPDVANTDSGAPDAGEVDAYVFYGPYAASPLPRIIRDATNNGSTTTTVPIDVPASLNVDFVDVYFEIAHQDSRDLLIDLLPPAGSSTRLHDGLSCTSNCSDNVVVDRRANVYNDTAGYWVLRVTDRAITHTGSVLSFTVSFVP